MKIPPNKPNKITNNKEPPPTNDQHTPLTDVETVIPKDYSNWPSIDQTQREDTNRFGISKEVV